MTATILATAGGWAVKKLSDAAVKSVADRLRDRAAAAELEKVVDDAVGGALAVVPELKNETIADDFANEVLLPVVVTRAKDPSSPFDPQILADEFLGRFVEPLRRGRSLDATLEGVLAIDRVQLVTVIETLDTSLRSGLYRSKHWRDAARDSAIEETRNTTTQIARHLGIDTGIDYARHALLQSDAARASEGLLHWPQTIEGAHIPRPELDVLLDRIRDCPKGRTLVIGEAGSGKSALFAELSATLQKEGTGLLAIKADLLPADLRDLGDLTRALRLSRDIGVELDALLRAGSAVLIIDQLDAVSDVMDRKSERMRLLLQLAGRYRPQDEDAPNLHVLVSSRPFEAAHDARFRALEAQKIQLQLPPYGDVETLLRTVGIDPAIVPQPLHQTLRRPFALKLFVDLVKRGEHPSALQPGQLLSEWLRTADLGDGRERTEALGFLESLAGDMTDTETLWRPADIYESRTPQAVQLSEACGLIVRHEVQIGFSHQAWLDDFQARRFSTGQDLAAFAIERQDGLFARATVLRGLERLRRTDESAYLRAVDALLGSPSTRRHLKHLIVDLITSAGMPLARERAWIVRLLREDPPLARRALLKIAQSWTVWKPTLQTSMYEILEQPEFRWVAAQLLHAIAADDPDAALDLIDSHWSGPEFDTLALDFFGRAVLWSPRISARVKSIVERNAVQEFAISHFADAMAAKGLHAAAAELLGMHLPTLQASRHTQIRYYGLEKLVDTAPLAFAKVLLPWFVALAQREAPPNGSLREIYPRSYSLPYDWDEPGELGDVMACVSRALASVARHDPTAFQKLVTPYLDVAIDQVQGLIAETLAKGDDTLAPFGLAFLLGDNRRFMVGDAHVDDIRGVGRTIQGWSSGELLEWLGPRVGAADRDRLRDAIESWNPYRPDAWENMDAKDRLRRLQWSEQARFALLERLPPGSLDNRRLRQVREWRATQTPLRSKGRTRPMASLVRSPMSAEQMSKAKDADLLSMLDTVSDGTARLSNHERFPDFGGSVELARAFAEFGKQEPQRALALARDHLKPGLHETAAGELVRELSGMREIDPQSLRELILALGAKGFASASWRNNAAWAFEAIAKRKKGLVDADLALLESWLVVDSEVLFAQILSHESVADKNRRNRGQDQKPQAVLFGHQGALILPQDNYTFLSAIWAGNILREKADNDGWLKVLERHVEKPEEPRIWSAVLVFQYNSLWWSNHTRVGHLLEKLVERCPVAFDDLNVGPGLWRIRSIVPASVESFMLDRWLRNGEEFVRQAAGEYIAAAAIVDPNHNDMMRKLDELLAGDDHAARIGALFGSALAWRDNTGAVRERAHAILMRYTQEAKGDDAIAIAAAIELQRHKRIDGCLQELLAATAENKELLAACHTGGFLEELEELLLYPGYDEIVLAVAEHSATLMLGKRSGGWREDRLVALAIALQRSPEPVRSRAMDLYERLLDADFYGAEKAAVDALAR